MPGAEDDVRDVAGGRQRAEAIGRVPRPRGRADLRGRHRRRGCGTGCSARRARRPASVRRASPATRHTAPATPGDLLFHIRAHRLDLCFELAQRLTDRLAGLRAGGRRGARVPVVRRARPARLRRRHREPGGRGGGRRGPDRRRGPGVRRRELRRRPEVRARPRRLGCAAGRGAGARDRPHEAQRHRAARRRSSPPTPTSR